MIWEEGSEVRQSLASVETSAYGHKFYMNKTKKASHQNVGVPGLEWLALMILLPIKISCLMATISKPIR